jgi:EthD domain
MIKMMILAPRRSGMTAADFRHYVTQVHGPLVRSVPEVVADIRRYHYNFPVEGGGDPLGQHSPASQFDILTEAWFDSIAAQQANMAHPRYLELVRPDEGRFADEANAVLHYVREVGIHDGPRAGNKLFYLRRRRPGLDRVEFQRAWQQRFPDFLQRHPSLKSALGTHLQNHTALESEHPLCADPRAYDLMDEFIGVDLAAVRSAMPTPEQLSTLRDLEAGLTDSRATRVLETETVRNVD